MDRQRAIEIITKYNKEQFHVLHALTVGGVMKYVAENKGEDPEYWECVGILHDVDFELYPDQHCVKAEEILKAENVEDDIIYSVCSHGFGLCQNDKEPIKFMEKMLFAADELTGLIWAGAKMRPSKSVSDMEVDSVKRKFKDKHFAAGCSRDVIKLGAERLEMPLEELMQITLDGMKACESAVNEEMQKLF